MRGAGIREVCRQIVTQRRIGQPCCTPASRVWSDDDSVAGARLLQSDLHGRHSPLGGSVLRLKSLNLVPLPQAFLVLSKAPITERQCAMKVDISGVPADAALQPQNPVFFLVYGLQLTISEPLN